MQAGATPNIVLFSASEASPTPIPCAAQETPINKKETIIVWPQSAKGGSSGEYWIYAEGLHEADGDLGVTARPPSVRNPFSFIPFLSNVRVDTDDPVGGAAMRSRRLKDVADRGWQYEAFEDDRGPGGGGPTLDVMYQVRTLK